MDRDSNPSFTQILAQQKLVKFFGLGLAKLLYANEKNGISELILRVVI
jgi:hypothetical protein